MANAIKLNLPSADDLFTTQEERDDAQRERVMDLPLSEISDFPSHPFKVKMDAEMQEMSESVKQYGVLVPGLVRPKEGRGYEMVAGHRRKMASELAGRGEMPCIVRNLTDDEATIIMVDSNLQRERILPSEKAFAYKMKLEAMNRQGQRTDLTSRPLVRKSESADVIGEQTGESGRQIYRYIRLTELIPEFVEMVDNTVERDKDKQQIAMRPAVELSYLPKEEQQTLREAIESEDCTPSHVQAMKIRKFSEEGRLSEDVILSILQEEKPNQAEQFKLPKEKISRFFAPETSAKTIEDTIVKALELWKQRERSRNDAR
ncbi:MAG: ParB/RepB/Spo0J family partition protein [Clostridiales Family XIII bacterium]|jgi:ParB family chromosome partitioning protein|nr:ParB/RepB/Spo0J family partition protein [Clostridiales Family XIII bacterium]